MKKLLAAVALSACVAWAHACENTFDVTVADFKVREDFTLDREGLSKVMGQSSGAGDTGLGAVVTRFAASVSSVQLPSGCRQYLVKTGYYEPVLYVMHEIVQNECAREHVLSHEYEHVGYYRDNLARMREGLPTRLLELGPSLASLDVVAAERLVLENVGEELFAVDKFNNALDAGGAYAENAQVCNGFLKSLARRSRFR